MNNLVLKHLIIGRSIETPLHLKIDYVFEVGKLYYLSGSNGSGKTTLMRTICGYLQPLTGEISANNLSLIAAYYGHDNALKHKMSVAEYLKFCCKIFENTFEFEFLITLFKLENLLSIPISYLSCGQKRRVSLVGFLICNRDIYCFDEASSGLDADFKTIFYNYLIDLATKKQKIIIFSDHVNPESSYQEHIDIHNFKHKI